MRTKKTIINTFVALASQIIIIFLGFFSRRVLIYSVGVQYLGINGLMTNILIIFSLAESGIGIAIGYALYKPLADNDIESIKSLMFLYKWIYRVFAFFTAVAGICFYPFLPLFLKGNTAPNVGIIYFLFLFSSVASYLWSYKTTINASDQNNYLYTIANTTTQIVVLIVKMLILYASENYVLYLTIDIGSTIIKNIVFSFILDKRYPFLKEKKVAKLSSDVKKNLVSNIKSLLLTKIGYIISQCSDNLVTSAMISVSAVGLYSNYTTLVNSVTGFVTTFTSGVTASMGNLMATEDNEYVYSVFKRIDFLNYLIYTFTAICLFCLIEPFITIWLGTEFVLSKDVLVLTIVLYYLKGINSAVDVVKNAGGLFRADKYVTIIEAVLNLGISIWGARRMGLVGVLAGTVISFIFCSFWVRPLYVYRMSFSQPFVKYLMELLKKIIIGCAICLVTYFLQLQVNLDSIFLCLLFKMVVTVLVSSGLLILFFHRSGEFIFAKNLASEILKKIRFFHNNSE